MTALRDRIEQALLDADESDPESDKAAVFRLIWTAIGDMEAMHGAAATGPANDERIFDLLTKMIHRRKRDIEDLSDQGQLAMVEREQNELDWISDLLPHRMSREDCEKAVDSAVNELKAKTVRDKSQVMDMLKKRYPQQMDFEHASVFLTKRLCRPC